MSLVTITRERMELYNSDSVEYKILNYLLGNAVGYGNAKIWDKIKKDLQLNSNMQEFQHGLLKYSRENGFFIGSSTKGYFIIDKPSDAEVAKSYYENRIQAEKVHLDALLDLVNNPPYNYRI